MSQSKNKKHNEDKKKSVEELIGFITNLRADKLRILSINKKKKEKEK